MRGWEDGIDSGLNDAGHETVELIHLAQSKVQWPALVTFIIKI
jgi:hypothetical protein